MLIGQLANATGVSRDTVRFYEKLGLIGSFRQTNGYKNYPEAALNTVHFVKLAQELGFSLAEIAVISPLVSGGALPTEQVAQFIEEKMALIDQRINTLQQLKQRLATLPIGDACPLRRDCQG